MMLPIVKKTCIRTKRLTLMPCRAADAERLAELLLDERVATTFMVPDFASPDEAVRLAERLIAFSRPEDTEHLEYGIYLEDELIGFINDCGTEQAEIEIGYVISPDRQGRGYATEAVSAILAELREMGFRTVRAGYFEGNTASCRVMEKCGMMPIEKTGEEEYRGRVHRCLYRQIVFA